MSASHLQVILSILMTILTTSHGSLGLKGSRI